MAFGILKKGSFLATFSPTKPKEVRRIGNLRQGVSQAVEDPAISPDVNRKIRVADLITGYGVSESVRHFYDLHGGDASRAKKLWSKVGATWVRLRRCTWLEQVRRSSASSIRSEG